MPPDFGGFLVPDAIEKKILTSIEKVDLVQAAAVEAIEQFDRRNEQTFTQLNRILAKVERMVDAVIKAGTGD
jgi:hypothetical protein